MGVAANKRVVNQQLCGLVLKYLRLLALPEEVGHARLGHLH